ncbi:MAG: nitrogen fixation protein FixP [Bacteroidetes bacterium CG12_big_fil_rev_8_21_14_0_65_60_17]|nr:MAG: nitrogen fixation protein FixP [Bacteroidetes bacterium CG12_big_fil_rev_8_21_14_0_65_60_17]
MSNDKHDDDPLIQGHNYDGIEEYDNPMPGWWVWLFWICVAFAPLYVLGMHVFDIIPTYEERLEAEQAELAELRTAWEAQNPTFEISNSAIAEFVGIEEAILAGEALFSANCAVCHGNNGEGLIGPNLTDSYWIHGNENVDIFNVITDGVLDKGMTPWGNVLSPEERSQLVAYIRSIKGSDPEGAKAPQGTLYEDEENAS